MQEQLANFKSKNFGLWHAKIQEGVGMYLPAGFVFVEVTSGQ